MDLSDLLNPRVLIVTGKGGVGKSVTAAALAVASARSGRRTALVEVEGRQTMSRLFDTQPWDFTEREFRPGLSGLSVDPEASLAEYLEMFYGARRLSRLVLGSSAVEFATTAAPGVKDVLLLGKVYEMETRRGGDGRFHYDLVVLDAPPTGRIVNFLRAPDAATALVHVGPIERQARSIIEMLTDPHRTHVQLVTLLEEMPVQETIESASALEPLGVTIGPLVVNRVLGERFDEAARKAFEEELEPAELAALLDAVGADVGTEGAAALRDLGGAHLQRLALQTRMRTELNALGLPRLELPYLYGEEFGAQQVVELARLIEEATA